MARKAESSGEGHSGIEEDCEKGGAKRGVEQCGEAGRVRYTAEEAVGRVDVGGRGGGMKGESEVEEEV